MKLGSNFSLVSCERSQNAELIVAREISGPRAARSDSPYDIHLFVLIFLALFFMVICLVTSCSHIVGGTSKNVVQ